MKAVNHTLCVAPMMEWTDRHCRYFLRLISKHTLLYTEMIATGALLHGDAGRFLGFNSSEQPVAIQLGGSQPEELARCAKLAEDYGYREVNLNVGCPSDRVQNAKIGACLMADPELIGQCVAAMMAAVSIPVTVKCRTGIDELDCYQYLHDFVATVAKAGCGCFIIHARIARLDGLSPKDNRKIPPLNYDRVYRIKENFPELEIIINGGIDSLSTAESLLEKVDGVMVGKEAYQNPYFLADVDRQFFGCEKLPLSRHQVMKKLLPYVEMELKKGVALKHISRHILGLFRGLPGAKKFRRYLSENAHRSNADISTLETALSMVPE